MLRGNQAIYGGSVYDHLTQLDMLKKMTGTDVKGRLSKALSTLI